MFTCLRPRTPYSPTYTLYTCIQYTNSHREGGKGRRVEPERRLEGQQFTHAAGSKIPTWLTVSPVFNSKSIFRITTFCFGVYLVNWSMGRGRKGTQVLWNTRRWWGGGVGEGGMKRDIFERNGDVVSGCVVREKQANTVQYIKYSNGHVVFEYLYCNNFYRGDDSRNIISINFLFLWKRPQVCVINTVWKFFKHV